MNMKMLKAAMTALVLSVSGLANAGLIYVGSYDLFDGEHWNTNPAVYSAIEAAEVVFGVPVGGAYHVSINGTDINNVSHTAWFDEVGVGPSEFAEAFSLDTNNDGYAGPGWVPGDDISAYVEDNSSGGRHINYVFIESTINVPESSTLAIFTLGIMGLTLRRFKKQS